MSSVACSGIRQDNLGENGGQISLLGGGANLGGATAIVEEWDASQAGGGGTVPSSATGGTTVGPATTGGTESISTGGSAASEGGATPVGTGGLGTGGTDSISTGGVASGGSEPISTGGVATGGSEPISTGGLATGGADPIGTGGVATGGAEPFGTGGSEPISTGGLATGGSEPFSTGGLATGGSDPFGSGGTEPISTGGLATGGSEPVGSGGTSTGGTESDAGTLHLSFTTDPTFTSNDNPAAPQVGIVRFTTSAPASGSISVSGGDEAWTVPLATIATTHEATLLGLKPDTSYLVTITVSDGTEAITSAALEWRTPALPGDFPRLDFIGSDPGQMEPGMTLFNVRGPYYLIVVDSRGQVRWYYSEKPADNDHRLLANGHLIFPSSQREITEIDWRGNVVACWYAKDFPYSYVPPAGAIPVSAQTFHHTIREMPSGNLLGLTTETRSITDYPTSTTDPAAATRTARLTGDVVVEFTRTGDVVKKIPLLDLLDPRRVGHNSTDASWLVPGAKDWSHSNSVIYDPATNAYIVSSRHQDAVLKIDRESGTLVWILGTHSNWGSAWQDKLLQPVGDLKWQYHQHAAELIPGADSPPGTFVLGLFDNGNNRSAAFEPPQTQYSRAVSFAIDEQQMTVTQLWSYGAETGSDSFYSMSMSDADWQPLTGNVLITAGRLQTTDVEGSAKDYSRLLEVNAAGTPVFEMYVRADDSSTTDYTTFNGKRIPDIRSAGFGQD